jgi:hypothetical protein
LTNSKRRPLQDITSDFQGKCSKQPTTCH